MMTPKLISVFLLLLVTSHAYPNLPDYPSPPKKIRICLEFESKELLQSKTLTKIFFQGKIVMFPIKDTCIDLKLDEKRYLQIFIETPEYVTLIIPIKYDTLIDNSTISIKAILKSELLKEITVRPDNQVILKGDTLIFDVKNVKTKPHGDANDLLKRIPGMRLGEYGNLEIGGQQVESVTINGRQIFGGINQITFDMIKASSISSLEVVKSRNNSGYLDMNIKLKENRDNGFYGDIMNGLGSVQTETQSLKINKITPNKFTNLFINNSNTSEKILSNSMNKQIQNVMSHNEMDRVQSLVSNHLGLFGELNFKPSSRGDLSIPELGNYRGINTSLSSGISQSYNYKNIAISGFILSEKNKQQLLNDGLNNNILGGGLIQRSSQQGNNSNENLQIWATIYAQWDLDSQNQLKFFTSLENRNLESSLNSSNLIDLIKNDKGLFRQSIQKNIFSTNVLNQITNKISWTHRYKKKGVVTSFLGSYWIEKFNTKTQYFNSLVQDSIELRGNNHKILAEFPINSFEIQIAQSYPISKKVLFELKDILSEEKLAKTQNALRYNPTLNSYSSTISALSIEDYYIKNLQNELQANILFKSSRSNLIAGLTYWHWQSSRNEIKIQVSKVLPTLYWQYKYHYDKSRYLTIYMNNVQVLPINDNIIPLADSSDIYLSRSGNSNLLNYSRWQSGISIMTSFHQIGIRPEIKYVVDSSPIQIQYIANSQNQLSQNFIQLGSTKRLSARLSFSNFTRYRSGFQFSTFFIVNEQNAIFGNNISTIKSFSGNTNFGIKINPSDKANISFNVQNFYNGFFDKSLMTVRFSFEIKSELELHNKSYLDLNANLNLSRNSASEFINLPIIDCSYSQFIFKNNAIKLTLKANNIFDVRRIYESFGNINIQNEAVYSRMPRFILLSMTYFWEKWRENKK